MAHKITRFTDDHEKYARCRCGFVTKKHRTRDDVEDEVRKHEEQIELLRLNLGTCTPSLASQRDYYRKMADDPNVSPADRRLWGTLADELDKRLGNPNADDDQPTLI